MQLKVTRTVVLGDEERDLLKRAMRWASFAHRIMLSEKEQKALAFLVNGQFELDEPQVRSAMKVWAQIASLMRAQRKEYKSCCESRATHPMIADPERFWADAERNVAKGIEEVQGLLEMWGRAAELVKNVQPTADGLRAPFVPVDIAEPLPRCTKCGRALTGTEVQRALGLCYPCKPPAKAPHPELSRMPDEPD